MGNQCRSMDLNYRGMLRKYGREGDERGRGGREGNQCRSMDLNYRGMLCKYGREREEGGGWGTSVAVWT